MKKFRYLYSIAAAMCLGSVGMSAAPATPMELLEQGRDAYMDYQFDEADRLYSQARKNQTRKKLKRPEEAFEQKYKLYSEQLMQAENFLDRVEKIVVIDSISVPRQDFFKAYKLPASAGMLSDGRVLPSSEQEGIDYVYQNEGRDYKLWARPDSVGNMQLVESTLLTDGKWGEATPLSEELSQGGDAIYPFMMADGVTLYYACNGEGSIGGYDIMVATRDAADGSFLQPSNLGFPYNSPYDDYMLAIDEYNGVGWWATERNQLEDEVTIYLFITNDMRTNYSSEDDDVVEFARLSDYRQTQPEDGDYEDLLATIRAIDPASEMKVKEFTLAASGGRIYHYYDELPSPTARTAMKKYLLEKGKEEALEKLLDNDRRQYHNSNSTSLAQRIAQREKDLEAKREEVRKLRSDLYKLLK
ncbi:MAG: hypothetical protein ACI4AK_07675 [Lepagella sp.]